MSNEMTAMELLGKLEDALMKSGISADEVGLYDEDTLCEHVETWISDRSYSLAADACELLHAAEQNRAKGEVEEPVFIIDFDGRASIAYTAEQLLENLPDELNKDLAKSLVSPL